ncbi:hypothetical protein HPP92_026480 [Vanilla planifolia]|uniref:Uncharacterized protein n=1 Tax=Vanilla planifolia TaxID=51239 RepID=A0A835PDG8_VANPL|nr:hypothetical protein HPP92_026480 [Vanilla planifolia]
MGFTSILREKSETTGLLRELRVEGYLSKHSRDRSRVAIHSMEEPSLSERTSALP